MTKAFEGVGFVIGEVFTYIMTDDYMDCGAGEYFRNLLQSCTDPNFIGAWIIEGGIDIWRVLAVYFAFGMIGGALGGAVAWFLGRLDRVSG